METPLFDQLARRGSEFLGVRYPIICGAMTWISDAHLVRAVSENGGFGVLAAGNMDPAQLADEIVRCAESLQVPFGVNLVTIAPNFEAHKEVVSQSRAPYVVFAGSFPNRRDVAEMKKAGKKVMAFASTTSIAQQMVRFGVDALILEGSEAGGHIGHVTLTILIQQVLFEEPPVPVFVAGGIACGRMIAHMLLMGAAGVQMGTRFVMSEECRAHERLKQAFRNAKAREAVETPQYDRRLPVVAVRALRNRAMEDFGRLQLKLMEKLDRGEIDRAEAQKTVEEFWMGGLRRAVVEGDIEGGSLMAGQSVGLVDKILPMKEIFGELLNDAECELRRVKALLSGNNKVP
ncbi:MAG: hypothetical protein DRP22_05405 [Verrucomicrobia bacterium]|nr:MAG: hypothetical protein DRP22_05405 [Verrucomicrobiota bacterium]